MSHSISLFRRRASNAQFSIERYFDAVIPHLNEATDVEEITLPHQSRGIMPRVKNLLFAAKHRRNVNHITGDVNYLALTLPKQRTIITFHDCQVLERLTGWRRWLVRKLWFELPIRRCSLISAVSERTKEVLIDEFSISPDRIRVIPTVIPDDYEPVPSTFNKDCPNILQIGTKENKNLDRLIDAIKGMRCRLTIIGPLPDHTRSRLQASEIDYRSLEGLSDLEIRQCYVDCDLVAFVSTHEGFGMPIIEANAIGRVVVTSNCSSMPEVAADAAVLVDPFDVDSIRDGVRDAVENRELRDQLIRNGFKNRERFRPAKIADMYVGLYHDVLNAPR